MSKLTWRVQQNHMRSELEVYLVEELGAGKANLGQVGEDGRIEMVRVGAYEDFPPTIRIPIKGDSSASALVDAVTEAGIPPGRLERRESKTQGLLEECQKRVAFLEMFILTSDLQRTADLRVSHHTVK